MDFYKKYKMMVQRSKRNPQCKVSEKIATVARGMFSAGVSRNDILATVMEIQSLEVFLPKNLTRYGKELELAVLSGNFTAKRPYQIRHKYEKQHLSGVIYLLSSPQKRGRLKLGATTLPIEKRIALFESKYGYQVKLVAAKTVKNVFLLENMVSKNLDVYRISGRTEGDSNEWYAVSYAKIWKEIQRAEQNLMTENAK